MTQGGWRLIVTTPERPAALLAGLRLIQPTPQERVRPDAWRHGGEMNGT
jgi:hypothetical protein